jgi:hypothetical protein
MIDFDENKEYISLFELFFNYASPIPLKHPFVRDFPISQGGYIKDTLTKESTSWVGSVVINHKETND